MIPMWPSRSSGLTCDTTSGTVGSIRQADELSITVAPCATAAGASSFETSAPAEKRAMSTPSKASGVASPISCVWPSTETVLPTDLPDASRRNRPTGKLSFVEDLDHGPADDAGGSDDGDGEGFVVHLKHGSADAVAGTGTAGV